MDNVYFGTKGALTTLKHVYRVKRSLYIYSTKNFIPYLMCDITNTSHVDTTSSLWGQIDKYPLWGQTNPHIGVKDWL